MVLTILLIIDSCPSAEKLTRTSHHAYDERGDRIHLREKLTILGLLHADPPRHVFKRTSKTVHRTHQRIGKRDTRSYFNIAAWVQEEAGKSRN